VADSASGSANWQLRSLLSTELDVLVTQVPVINALVLTLSNLCEYRHKSYIAKKTDSLGYLSVADITGLSSTT